ncbi:hypothetical protein [Stackebrandtia soli]|uniref:hypothetical protein n=1 Tax=Stackebrandtia soli TaxID=1892856 RepID=UPI0039E9D08F
MDPYPAGYLGDPIATADIPGLCESFGAAASRVILDGSLMEMEPPVGDESAYRADCSFGDQDQRSVDGTWAMLSQIKPGDPEPDLTDCDDAGIEAGLGFDEIPICSQMRPARHLGADWAVYWWQRQTTYILAVNEPAEDADLDAFVSDVMAVIEQT